MFILFVIILCFNAMPALGAGRVDATFGKVPLGFERNEGQFDSSVKFLARGRSYGLFLTDNEAIIRFTSRDAAPIRMKLLRKNRHATIQGLAALPGTTNYLRRGAARFTGIRSYEKVRYADVYAGIDLEYHGNGRSLEYDFVLQPEADPEKIELGFSGIRDVYLDVSGDLVLKTDAGPLVQKKPVAYQDIDGSRRTVDAAYLLHGKHIQFKLGQYDKTRPLVIDPQLVYSTFFGGSGADGAFGIAVDAQGAVYIAGATNSTDFPNQSGVQSQNKGGTTDAFVFKLDPTGTRIVYSTYIGGTGTDEAHSIAVDSGGNAYITGYTQSTDFPVVNGFQKTRAGAQDAYVLKLNSFGTGILYSSYLGGSADDRGTGIAVDPGSNAYVTGTTGSTNFPTTNPYQPANAGGFADGFVTKINAAGAIAYSTYVGGIGNDNPLSIAVDNVGAAYVTGWTTSVNFPTVNAFQSKFGGLDQPVGTDDVFVFKLNPAGTALVYSTYIGGTGSDEATRIAIDVSGNAYVTGYTSSLNYPTVNPYQPLLSNLSGLDAFISKLSADGKSLVFSTYFGGFQVDSGTGIAVDATGAVYVAGYTTSFDLPTANQTQTSIGGDRDAFVAKFDPAGNVLVFSTFLGGSGTESATGLAIDSIGDTYVLGFTNSGDFPTTNAIQSGNAGGQDLFIAKLNVADIVSSSQFQVAPEGASSVVTKGTRTDAVFGYALADPVIAGTRLTGLSIISRKQNGATVSEVGIPAPPFVDSGRLFVDLTSSGQSVLSIANPNDEDATVNMFYTDQAGATNQYITITVKAHEHFSSFITSDPLNIFAPGTLNFTSTVPVAATAFSTITNESSELLISRTPIVDPVGYTQQVGSQTVTIPEIVEGGGWKSDIILVNTGEDRMNGSVQFLSPGSPAEPGAPMELGLDAGYRATAVEFDIPGRSFQKISTAGTETTTDVPFAINRGTTVSTPGSGSFQVTGLASADSTFPDERLNGLQIIQYRQLGVTQSQTGVLAPPLRQSGRFFAELTDKARPSLAIANPNGEDVSVDVSLTDENGTSTDPINLTVPAGGQFFKFLSDQPISLANNTSRTVSFSASLPVFVTALRFFTNERSDSVLSAIPVMDIGPLNQPVVIPQFANGLGWKTQVVLVNNGDDELHGEIHFVGQGTLTDPPPGVFVGTDLGDNWAFEYTVPPRSFFRLQTDGLADVLSTGSVRIVPFLGYPSPAAYAAISVFVIDEAATAAAGATRGNTIFETSIEGQLPSTNLRLYAEGVGDFDAGIQKSTRTSIAMANPSNDPATMQLELTSFDGRRLGISLPITLPGNGQISGFLTQMPGMESLAVPYQGVLRVSVLSGSVTAASFRVMFNERKDYLVTTTGPLNENAGMPGRLVFPYVTDSTGYTTQFILINAEGAASSSGVLRYLAADGSPLGVDTLMLGSAQIVPGLGYATPHAHVVLNHRDNGVLTSIVGVEAELPTTTLRMYVEGAGDFDPGIAGSTRSAVALANPSDVPATVVLEVKNLDGVLLQRSQPLQVPPNGQVSFYVNQAPGLQALPSSFAGSLSITATSPAGITATGFRAANNERGNVLFTTTGPLYENAGNASQLVFPHIAEGGGYTTQFVVIGGLSGQGNAGVLRFFNQQGNPLNVTLTPR